MNDLCPNKKECGSCSWSDIPYKDQLIKKRNLINNTLSEKGILFNLSNVIPSPRTSHYRNRMDFAIDYQGNVGLRAKGKWWKVLDGHCCFISDEKIEEVFHECRKLIKTSGISFWDRKTNKGLLRYLVIRTSGLGQLMVNIVTGKPESGEMESKYLEQKLMEIASCINPSVFIWSQNFTSSDVSMGTEMKILKGAGYIEEKVNDLIYRISPNSFFQTNIKASALLQNIVMSYIKIIKPESLLDLYCGSGFFSLPASRLVKSVTGVEFSAESIKEAEVNASINNCKVNFVVDKSENYLPQNIKNDLIILDPPRSGLHPKVIETILLSDVKNIIYVSCNYKKFAEEMILLQKKYKIGGAGAVDMFPHTEHVELITLLELV